MIKRLTVVALPGIRPESLGTYLTGVGLLSALSAEWPDIRGWWNDTFTLAATGLSFGQIDNYLLTKWTATHYERWWKGMSDIGIARASASLHNVRILDAHIVQRGSRKLYNDVFGTGGNVGKRDFSKVASICQDLIKKDPHAAAWLDHTLTGRADVLLPDLPSTGTWFASANKAFNSGISAAREGQLSPWAFLLALEGAFLLRGNAARRLGSRSRPYAAFPFISDAGAPQNAGRLGSVRSEFWAPIWGRPASLIELQNLLHQGLARVGNRAARAPHDFAAAAMTAGTQAGVTAFARFSLEKTTSGNTFEAIPRGTAKIQRVPFHRAIVEIANWISRLPEDKSSRLKKEFVGLRSPAERALVSLSEHRLSGLAHGGPVAWDLLKELAAIQFRVDRNRRWRERTSSLGLVDESLVEDVATLPGEAAIARAIASIQFGNYRLIHNVWGLEQANQGAFADPRPASVVWHEGDPYRVLADVLERRLLDTDAVDTVGSTQSVLQASRPVAASLLNQFLQGFINAKEIVESVPPMCLISHNGYRRPLETAFVPCPEFLLQALFRPLLSTSHPLNLTESRGFINLGATAARTLVKLIRSERWNDAFDFAERAYRVANLRIIRPSAVSMSGDQLAAALLVPLSSEASARHFRGRWLVSNLKEY